MNESEKQYTDLIDELATDKPQTASLLRMAQKRRETKLQQYLNGARLSGFEELLEHLDIVHARFSNHTELSKVAFLLRQSGGEFITALEALFSGFHTVAHDAMRAVMEIEFLLRDFSLDTSRMDEWLKADPKTLYDKFRPAVLRQRFANYIGEPVNSLSEATDYKGHSMFLHVGPDLNPFGISGLTEDSNEFATDSCFWEIFEHARRLLIAIHTLANTFQSSLLADHNPEELERLGTAWVRTQEMQQIWQQLIGFRGESYDSENDA